MDPITTLNKEFKGIEEEMIFWIFHSLINCLSSSAWNELGNYHLPSKPAIALPGTVGVCASSEEFLSHQIPPLTPSAFLSSFYLFIFLLIRQLLLFELSQSSQCLSIWCRNRERSTSMGRKQDPSPRNWIESDLSAIDISIYMILFIVSESEIVHWHELQFFLVVI